MADPRNCARAGRIYACVVCSSSALHDPFRTRHSRTGGCAILLAAIWACAQPSHEARILHADVRGDGRQVALALESCDANNRATVEEGVRRVVVTVTTDWNGQRLEGCSDGVEIELKRPLTDRILIDGSSGEKVSSAFYG